VTISDHQSAGNFPLDPSAHGALRAPLKPRIPADHAMKTIALIEDDPDLQELLRYNLEREGYSFAGSKTGDKRQDY
jgi:hypothetical protein